MTVTIGLNGYRAVGHDAAAALMIDDRIVAAVEEERLTRVKHAYGSPPVQAIKEVLDIAGISASEVDLVTYPWLPSAMGMIDTEVAEEVLSWFVIAGCPVRREVRVQFVEHHLAHALSGIPFVPGGIRGRRLGMLALDEAGESTGGACYVYDGALERKWCLEQTGSLGTYFSAVSRYLGFKWGEEGKTMGLAAYGRPGAARVPPVPDRRAYAWPGGDEAGESPRDVTENVRRRTIAEFRKLHGDNLSFTRAADVATAAQSAMASRILQYAIELIDEIDVLIMSGGVALNCTINMQVAALCRARGVELVVPPPASDTGVALGSTLAGAKDPAAVAPLPDALLGRMYSPEDIARELHIFGVEVTAIDARTLAEQILDRSLVCGRFEGRSEVGPRALGKRSVIARGDDPAVRDRINASKGREPWRPLAPSVTESEFDRCFAGCTPSPTWSSRRQHHRSAVSDSPVSSTPMAPRDRRS